MQFDPEVTIAALATPPGNGALGVIRISGPEATKIGEKVFFGKRKLAELKGYEAAYGHACDSEGKRLDEVVVLHFAAPKSYTGEESIEFFCHGGMAVLQSVLEALYKAGARPAAPGEFTRRALMNGKLSLTQAEGIGVLVAAENRQAADLALAQREGRLSVLITRAEENLLNLQAHLSALIDFPEEDLPDMSVADLIGGIEEEKKTLDLLLDQYESGQMLTYGIQTALLGPPNAGKSSLMNRLCGKKRSIVTDIPGTTRDLIEATVRLEELTLHLTDTAGLTETIDPVEAEGVVLAQEKLESAQLVFLVLESGGETLPEKWLAVAEKRPCVLVWNKIDRCNAPIPAELAQRFPLCLAASVETGEGMEKLPALIRQAIHLHHLDAQSAVLLNVRQKDAALRARDALDRVYHLMKDIGNFDLASAGLQEALDELFALSGRAVDEQVIERVFSTFCVGK